VLDYHFRGATFGEAYRQVMLAVMERPDAVCSPRGMAVREVLGARLVLDDPRARVLASPARAANYGFAAGEFLWYWRGASDVASIDYYNRRMKAWSDDGQVMAGAYGPRVRGDGGLWDRGLGGRSQWELAVDELVRDPDSRRAVVGIYVPYDAVRAATGTKDVPCTLSIQFLLRRSWYRAGRARPRLHAVVTMRSCDAVWGLANDVFSFTLLQEAMLLELQARGVDAELGAYVHTCGSLHVYSRHDDLARAVAAEAGPPAPPVPAIDRRGDLDLLVEDERALREGRRDVVGGDYSGGARWLLERLLEHRARRDAGPAGGGAAGGGAAGGGAAGGGAAGGGAAGPGRGREGS